MMKAAAKAEEHDAEWAQLYALSEELSKEFAGTCNSYVDEIVKRPDLSILETAGANANALLEVLEYMMDLRSARESEHMKTRRLKLAKQARADGDEDEAELPYIALSEDILDLRRILVSRKTSPLEIESDIVDTPPLDSINWKGTPCKPPLSPCPRRQIVKRRRDFEYSLQPPGLQVGGSRGRSKLIRGVHRAL